MKITGVFTLLIGLLAPVVFAASAPAPAPAAKAPAAPVPAPKEKEEPAKIDGVTIPRANGTFLGLEILNNNFVLKFYGKDKKRMKPDVMRAAAHWPVKYQPADARVVLNPADDTLTSPFVVRPPHQFKVTLTLLSDDPDAAAETYSVDYRE